MKLWKWLVSNKSNNLFSLIIVIIGALSSYFASITTSSKNINKLKLDIIDNQKQTTTFINESPNTILSITDEEGRNSNHFNSENWVLTKGMIPNNEGYYCPTNIGFPSWSMWTKNKYKADVEISITFSLQDKTKNKKNPTLYFSYGDKTSDAPDTFYRFNILDGDLNTIRLYDRRGNEIIFERSINNAPLDKFITFTISPVFPNKKSSTLILNPEISYQIEGEGYNFEPKNEFKTNLPLSSGDNQGDGFQFGIGISKGDCFKIITTNL